MTLFKVILFLQVFLFASLPEAQAKVCEESDLRGLNLKPLPPAYGEAICQLKILLLRRTNHDSLNRFLLVHGDQLGISHNDLNMSQPLVKVVNDLFNLALAEGKMQKLSAASQRFFVTSGQFSLELGEKELLELLVKIDVQHGGLHR